MKQQQQQQQRRRFDPKNRSIPNSSYRNEPSKKGKKEKLYILLRNTELDSSFTTTTAATIHSSDCGWNRSPFGVIPFLPFASHKIRDGIGRREEREIHFWKKKIIFRKRTPNTSVQRVSIWERETKKTKHQIFESSLALVAPWLFGCCSKKLFRIDFGCSSSSSSSFQKTALPKGKKDWIWLWLLAWLTEKMTAEGRRRRKKAHAAIAWLLLLLLLLLELVVEIC